MNHNQTVAEFLQPHVNNWLQAETNYTQCRAQIIRAEAERECQLLFNNTEKASKKQKLVERLERRKERLSKKTHWTDAILKPIALLMVEELNGYTHEILGPFGLNCETSIWIWPTQRDAENRGLNNLHSVTFVSNYIYDDAKPIHNVIGIDLTIKDYSVNKKAYPQGSIGDLNGMNHPNINIMEWSMQQLIERFNNQKQGD